MPKIPLRPSPNLPPLNPPPPPPPPTQLPPPQQPTTTTHPQPPAHITNIIHVLQTAFKVAFFALLAKYICTVCKNLKLEIL